MHGGFNGSNNLVLGVVARGIFNKWISFVSLSRASDGCKCIHRPQRRRSLGNKSEPCSCSHGREKRRGRNHRREIRGGDSSWSPEEVEISAMDSRAPSAGTGMWEGLYRLLMRRNSIYVTFVVAGAFVGERVVDYGVHKLWEMNNTGKRYEDIPVLGQRPAEE